MRFLTVLLFSFFIVVNAVGLNAAGSSKNSKKFFGSIDWNKPMVELSGGYIFVPGDSFSSFLDDTKSYAGTYNDTYDSRNGGFTVNLDVLWDMNFAKSSKSPFAPWKLYAGLGVGFLQVASASWEGSSPNWYYGSYSAYDGDYSASYFIVPLELKAKYYMFIKGLYVSAGLGIGIESITYTFKYPGGYEITDEDSEWTYKPKETGTGAGFICNIGAGYNYELYKNVSIGGGLDVYFYFGKSMLICPNPKIGVVYKF